MFVQFPKVFAKGRRAGGPRLQPRGCAAQGARAVGGVGTKARRAVEVEGMAAGGPGEQRAGRVGEPLLAGAGALVRGGGQDLANGGTTLVWSALGRGRWTSARKGVRSSKE